MKDYRKLWLTLLLVLTGTFILLGYYGHDVYRNAPPVPERVMTADGTVLYTRDNILDGQTAWQSAGGMHLGSVWGHGAYQAPDWSADWLHRELTTWLDLAAQELHGQQWAALPEEQRVVLQLQLKNEYRNNTLADGTLVVSARRAHAIAHTADYYQRLFSVAPELRGTRESYAMKENTLPDAQKRAQLTAFFFWTAWATATKRPGSNATWTNNWPHEPLIDNVPTAENVVWSIVSVVLLVAGVGLLVWAWSFLRSRDLPHASAPTRDPIAALALTASQRALGKYLFIVVALLVFQVFIGAFTAHYTVEGQMFYGIDVSQWIPYTLARTWHIQAALFWIATGFLAAGLFLVPIINGGKDPAYQKLGVDVLFWALVAVVAGSFIGEFLAIAQVMPSQLNFWFGHQGYEYIELGRVWQIGKFVGVAFWLVLMLRGIAPA
ncbi:MAG: cbb3-type cytochrome c oxidase subunit I, partial [Gammaproteobacteria bacterium]